MATITTRSGKGSALTHQEVDANFTGLNTELGQKEVASNKGVANGYASLDAAGKVPSAQLPSYVDDVVEAANLASLPGTGETGKIYVTLDTNKTYRWSGSAYVEISPSPGSTDSLAEGSTNLYFTQARARASVSASGSLSYNSTTGVFSFSDAVTSVAGRTGAVTLTSSDVGLGSVENKSSATIRGELTSGNVTTALGFTPYNATNPSGYITSSALSSYLPLSGGTMSGKLKISLGGGTTPSNYLEIANTSSTTGQRAGLQLNTGASWSTTVYTESGNWWHAFGSDVGDFRWGYDGTNLKVGSNTVLHAGNYNSYSPTLTGTGASGTWGISITGSSASTTGNAATATALQTARTINGVSFNGTANITVADSTKLPLAGGTLTGNLLTAAADRGVEVNWSGGVSLCFDEVNAGALGGTGNLYLGYRRTGQVYVRGSNIVLGADNYNSYAPTLTGGGASGTWGISISGSAAQLNGRSVHQIFNNMGQNHGTYTNFNNIPEFGAYYVQGSANGPGTGSEQFYGFTLGLGDDFAYSSYALQIAIPRYNFGSEGGGPDRYISIRSRESGVWNAWQKIRAGYADTAGSVTNGLTTSNYSSYALPLTGGTVSGTLSVSSAYGTMAAAKGSYFGYSSGYGAVVLGSTSGYQTTCIGVDPIGNPSGSFSGLGHEVMFRNGATFISPNASNNGFHTYFSMSGGVADYSAALRQSGNQVLHAGNYTSYSPSLTGSGASGTWGINITGTSGALSGGDSVFYGLLYNGVNGDLNTYNSPGLYSAEYTGSTNKPSGANNGHWIQISDAGGTDVKTQWYFNNNGASIWMRVMWGNGSWQSWRSLLHDGNYSSYALPLSGGTMSGAILLGSGVPIRDVNGEWIIGKNSAEISIGSAAVTNGIAFNSASNSTFTYRGQQILHAGNYNSYSPTLTGTGASGTWGISVSGSAAQLNGLSSIQLFNNMGIAHSGFASGFDSVSNFGPFFIQGTGQGPGTGSSQFYGLALGLGNDYAYGSYALQLAIPRYNGSDKYITMRTREAATWGSWTKINAGYADSAGSVSGGLTTSNYSSYALPLSGGTMTGQLNLHAGSYEGSITFGSSSVWRCGIRQHDDADAELRIWHANAAGMIFLATGYNGEPSAISRPTDGLAIQNNRLGIGDFSAEDPAYKLHVKGDIYATANVTAYSDERVKANWRRLDDGFLVKLAGVKSGIYDRVDIDLTQAGVSAQSLREVLPETVMESQNGDLSVAYGNAALVSAVELAKELVALKHKVAELEARVH